MSEEIKPENPAGSTEDKMILKVTISPNGSMSMVIGNGVNLQLMSYVHKLLGVEIDKKIIDDKIRSIQENPSRIIKPQSRRGGIIDFMRGNRHAG